MKAFLRKIKFRRVLPLTYLSICFGMYGVAHVFNIPYLLESTGWPFAYPRWTEIPGFLSYSGIFSAMWLDWGLQVTLPVYRYSYSNISMVLFITISVVISFFFYYLLGKFIDKML
jgi:hypothetical protein